MASNATIYVFTCGHPGTLGFTFERGGRNLPHPHRWLPQTTVPLSQLGLRPFGIDLAAAIADLKRLGHHVAGAAFDGAHSLPIPHRQPS